MNDPNAQLQRLVSLVSLFVGFIVAGLVSMRLTGDSSGSIGFDVYKILKLFVLSGDWVFEEQVNGFLKAQAYIAPIFTVIGIIEIFTARFLRRISRSIRLMMVRDHAVLAGLTSETMYLLKSLNEAGGETKVVVIDQKPSEVLAAKCRRLGAILITGDAGNRAVLAQARVDRAQIAISFLSDATDSLQFVLSTNAQIDHASRENSERRRKSVDLWLRLGEAGLGLRLSEYFKFAGLSASAHPRFFSIDEIAARRLIRAHPPDIYADAQGQQELHLCLYGFNSLCVQILTETLRQCVTSGADRLQITVYTENPKTAEAEIRALVPGLDDMASMDVQALKIYPNGIAEQDYMSLPERASMHVVCYQQPEVSVSVALSLRRLLLTPPSQYARVGGRRHNAPILVRLANTRGIGELLRSNVDRRGDIEDASDDADTDAQREIPDGIFAFGAVEDILTGAQDDLFVPTLIDPTREKIAKFLHYSYVFDRTELRKIREQNDPEFLRAEKEWEQLAPEFRESSRQSADHIWTKARVMRYRISARAGATGRLALNDEEHRRLAELEHRRWANERILSGWSYGEKRVDAARRHHLLKPWRELEEIETKIDRSMAARIGEAIESVGLGLRRELVIGIVGHRPNRTRAFDVGHVRRCIRAKFETLIANAPDREPILLTALAEGADTIAAEIALEMGIPYWVPLPMPYEAYSQDFSDDPEKAGADGMTPLDRLRRLVAFSERYIELPLAFGDLTEVSLPYHGGETPNARVHQYALSGAFIAERADVVVAVWDGEPSRGIGGTADVVGWRAAGAVPPEYATPNVFRSRPAIVPAEIISPCP